MVISRMSELKLKFKMKVDFFFVNNEIMMKMAFQYGRCTNWIVLFWFSSIVLAHNPVVDRAKVTKERRKFHHRSSQVAQQQPYDSSTVQSEQNTPPSPNTIKILAFGDSLTEGMVEKRLVPFAPYSTKLEQLLNENSKNGHSFQIINDGISGQCVFPEMLTRLPISLQQHSANLKLVIILGGTNDLRTLDCENSVDLDEELIKLHQTAHDGGYKTVAVTIPEADERSSALPYSYEKYRELWSRTNERLRQYASKSDNNAVLCDLAEDFPMFSLHPTHKDLFWSDTLHPTKIGYERMAELLYEIISKMEL